MKRVNDNEVYYVRSTEDDDSHLYVIKSGDELIIEINSQYGNNSFTFTKEVLEALTLLITPSKAH